MKHKVDNGLTLDTLCRGPAEARKRLGAIKREIFSEALIPYQNLREKDLREFFSPLSVLLFIRK